MAALDRHRTQRRRLGLVAGGLAVWVIAVIVGSGPAGDDALLGVERVEVLWLASMAAVAILGLVLLILLNPFSREWTEPEKKKRRPWGLTLLLLLALVIWKPDLLDGLTPEQLANQDSAMLSGTQEEASDGGTDRAVPVAQATDVLVVLAVVGACGAVLVALSRRAAAQDEPVAASAVDEPNPTTLDATLGQATAVLRDTTDPRVAVMQSYAVLEAALAELGFGRDPAQTPAEHVTHVLKRIKIDPAPISNLGELYERARFSRLTITEADRISAAEALDETRHQLAIQA